MPFTPGFQLAEALDLLAMCASVEDEVAPPIPSNLPGWTCAFDSPVIGPFDEKWQLWRSAAGAWAIALRGTVMEAGSIFEDLISVLVPATDAITVGSHTIPYKFAEDPAAGVHLGFALGTLLLLKDPTDGILAQLAAQGVPAGSDIFITGHSQGAAMATLLRSYLEYEPSTPAGCSYKTYVFAQPKPGNYHYALDFEHQFANVGLAFRVTNSLDWVPQVPFTLEFIHDLNDPNPLSVLLSSSPVMTFLAKALERVLEDARSLVETHAHARLHVKAAALAQKVAAPAPGETLMGSRFHVPVLASLDFEGAGTEVALLGTPARGKERHDAFYEHHATTYYALLQAQRPAPGGGTA